MQYEIIIKILLKSAPKAPLIPFAILDLICVFESCLKNVFKKIAQAELNKINANLLLNISEFLISWIKNEAMSEICNASYEPSFFF